MARIQIERNLTEFPRGVTVRNTYLNKTGMVVGHSDRSDRTNGWPIIQYENGWVFGSNPKDLVRGHWEKIWVDERK